jgi:hypothetical protein
MDLVNLLKLSPTRVETVPNLALHLANALLLLGAGTLPDHMAAGFARGQHLLGLGRCLKSDVGFMKERLQ